MKRRLFALALLLALFTLAGCETEVKNVTTSVDAPTNVKKGEKFDIVLHVTNTDASRTQKFVSADISDKYLAGIHIEGAEPKFSESTHIPIDNTVSYVFNLDLPPNQEKTVTLKAVAMKSGDFGGGVDFCINSDYAFITQQVRTVIE